MFRLRIYLSQEDQNQMPLWQVGRSSHAVDVRALISFDVFQLCDVNFVMLDSAHGWERKSYI